MVRTLVSVFLVVGTMAGSVPAFGQSGAGSLVGYVKDEQGGVLPGVTVTAKSAELIAPVVGVTDNAGYYRLNNLPPGTFSVNAELTGFGSFQRDGILMRAGSTFTVDIELKVGGLQESITVSGDSPMIETGSPATILTVSGDLLRAAPVTARRLRATCSTWLRASTRGTWTTPAARARITSTARPSSTACISSKARRLRPTTTPARRASAWAATRSRMPR